MTIKIEGTPERVNLVLSQEEKMLWRRAGRDNDMNLSEFVRHAVSVFIENQKKDGGVK